jgi:transposase
LKIVTQQEIEILQLEIQKLKQTASTLADQLEKANQKIAWFQEQFNLVRRRQFGKQSETSQSLNFTLFDDHESDEVTETVKPIDAEREQVTYSRAKRKENEGRTIDTSKLVRERQLHDLSDEEKICSCGCALDKIGEDTSEQLEYIPETVKVIEHIRPKYTCRSCDTVKSAKKPEQPLPKSMAASSLIAEVVIKKYDHHLPLYRQSKILAQEGIDIPDNTLGNWVMGGADGLALLRDAFCQQLQKIRLLQADETPVKILQPDKKGYMWAYQSLDPGNQFIFFEFHLSREGHHPSERLKSFCGILQTDGYYGYNELRKRTDVVNLGCWDHARRKFTDAIKVNNDNKEGLAGQMLRLINKLYAVERDYKTASIIERYEARQKCAKPILEEIFAKAHKAAALPKGLLGKAIGYLKNNQPELIEYINYGDTHISNCLTENQIRPFALGRKNWLFVGNEASANKSALWYSLIQSCKINGINPRKYLVAVLNKVHVMRRGEIDPTSLLPQFIDRSLLES